MGLLGWQKIEKANPTKGRASGGLATQLADKVPSNP